MASAGAVRMGKAFVEAFLDDSKLMRGLGQVERRLQSFGNKVGTIGASIGAIGVAAGAMFIPAVNAASDMEETMGKFRAVFGELADGAKKWGDNFAGEVGRSKRQIADFMASAQDTFVPLGFDRGNAAALSKTLTALAVDLASFNNMDDDDAANRLIGALIGNHENVRRFGVIITETSLNAQLMKMGIAGGTKAASEQEKVMARLTMILEGTKDAQGDALRTAGSFANVMKKLWAVVDDSAVAFGENLLPVLTPVARAISKVIQKMADFIGRNQTLAQQLLFGVAGVTAFGGALIVGGFAVTAMGAAIGAVTTVVGVLAGAVVTAGTAIAAVFGSALAPILAVGVALGGLAAYWLFFTESGGAALGEFKEVALAVFDAVKSAMMAGDWKLAGDVLFAALRLAWTSGLSALTNLWTDFATEVELTALDLMASLETAWRLLPQAVSNAVRMVLIEMERIHRKMMATVETVQRVPAMLARGHTPQVINERLAAKYGMIDSASDAKRDGLPAITADTTDIEASRKVVASQIVNQANSRKRTASDNADAAREALRAIAHQAKSLDGSLPAIAKDPDEKKEDPYDLSGINAEGGLGSLADKAGKSARGGMESLNDAMSVGSTGAAAAIARGLGPRIGDPTELAVRDGNKLLADLNRKMEQLKKTPLAELKTS